MTITWSASALARSGWDEGDIMSLSALGTDAFMIGNSRPVDDLPNVPIRFLKSDVARMVDLGRDLGYIKAPEVSSAKPSSSKSPRSPAAHYEQLGRDLGLIKPQDPKS
jgi:hypothetical protein